MTILEIISGVLLILASIAIVILVLLQDSKGNGLAGVIGGGEMMMMDGRSRTPSSLMVKLSLIHISTRHLYTCCALVKNKSWALFFVSMVRTTSSPSFSFCSPDMRSESGVIFLKSVSYTHLPYSPPARPPPPARQCRRTHFARRGKAGASKIPVIARRTINDINPVAKPWNKVATDQPNIAIK